MSSLFWRRRARIGSTAETYRSMVWTTPRSPRIFAFGTFDIHRLLREGPAGRLILPPAAAIPNRPMSVVDEHHLAPAERRVAAGE
jgi:hypothetical protein